MSFRSRSARNIRALMLGAAVTACALVPVVSPATSQAAFADTASRSNQIVAGMKGTWTSPPTNTTAGNITNAPLLGNGDLGVVLNGDVASRLVTMGKNEFWSLAEGRVMAMARMAITMPDMAGASYLMTQNLDTANATGTYVKGATTVTTTDWVQADDSQHNLYITKYTNQGSTAQPVSVSFAQGNANPNTSASGSSGSVLTFDTRSDSVDSISGYATPKVRVATKAVGATGTVSNGTLSFSIPAGGTVSLVSSVMSNYDSPNYQADAIAAVATKTAADVSTLATQHQTWWTTFYGKSYLQINDPALLKSFYGSLYLMGSASRSGEAAPGLWGSWAPGDPDWDGDYHLNYNYEVPYLFTFAVNHPELAENYDKPILDWLPNAQAKATASGFQGAYYPVGLGPLPNGSGDSNAFWNQKTNAAFAAVPMLAHYAAAPSTAYATSIYPMIKQTAIFWQNYLSWDATNSRWVILNDAQHEGDSGTQTNGVMSLGLVRNLLQGAIELSTVLNVDAASRTTWQNQLNQLSAFPTQTRNGQTVFRYTEVGRDWNSGNSIGIQHIYPAGQIGLESPAALRQVALNTIDQMARWNDNNGSNTFFPAAVRVGYSPSAILANLRSFVASRGLQNTLNATYGGGLENLNTVPATLTEMLVQSNESKLRVFANWDANKNVKFADLRAKDGVLVSGELSNRAVNYVQLKAGASSSVTVANPWPAAQSLRLYRNGQDAGVVSGADLALTFATGDVLLLVPDGTSYAAASARLDAALPADPAPITAGSFSSGLEVGHTAPTWTNTVDSTGGGLRNVGAFTGSSAPELTPRTGEVSHSGNAALMYSGSATNMGATAADHYAYLKAFDLSAAPIPVTAGTTLSYWVYPQSSATSSGVPVGSTESTCVAVDLVFSNGTKLRDSGSVDQTGDGAHPASQCNRLTLDTWNQVTVNLGTQNTGKQIVRIMFAYDHRTTASGGYRGYFDDISIASPATFSSGLEAGQTAPTWTNTVDTVSGGLKNVGGIAGNTTPELAPRSGERAHTGSAALMYSGSATNMGTALADHYAYLKVFDLSAAPVPISAATTLSYWVFPQSNATTPWVAAGSTESTCVAVDLVFSDGTKLRDSGSVDQTGDGAHPASQCNHLTLDAWNQVTVNLGTKNTGKQVVRVMVAYDHRGTNSGGYRGYFDDITIG